MNVPSLTLDGWVARIRAAEILISLSPDTSDELLLHLANDISDYVRLHKSEQSSKCPTIQPAHEKPAKIPTNASEKKPRAQKTAKRVNATKVTNDTNDTKRSELTWTDDEVALLCTCVTAHDAQFIYQSHYPDKRTDNAVWQKWNKLEHKGCVLRVGQHVRVFRGDLEGNVGQVLSFTDDHTHANITINGKPGAYQVQVLHLVGADA